MNYTVVGFIGEFSLPLNAKNGALTFKLIPTGDYLRELPDEKDTNKKKRQILLVEDAKKAVERNAVLVDADSKFSFCTTTCGYLVPSLVALKTAKAKILVLCDKKCVVSSITVL